MATETEEMQDLAEESAPGEETETVVDVSDGSPPPAPVAVANAYKVKTYHGVSGGGIPEGRRVRVRIVMEGVVSAFHNVWGKDGWELTAEIEKDWSRLKVLEVDPGLFDKEPAPEGEHIYRVVADSSGDGTIYRAECKCGWEQEAAETWEADVAGRGHVRETVLGPVELGCLGCGTLIVAMADGAVEMAEDGSVTNASCPQCRIPWPKYLGDVTSREEAPPSLLDGDGESDAPENPED